MMKMGRSRLSDSRVAHRTLPAADYSDENMEVYSILCSCRAWHAEYEDWVKLSLRSILRILLAPR